LKVYLVHHTPMDDVGRFIAKELENKINTLTNNLQVILIDIRDFRNLEKEVVVGAFFPTRGGHYHFIKKITLERGYRFIRKLPNQIFSNSILRHHDITKCSSLDILYWGAKNHKESQMEDLIEIKKGIDVLVGTNLVEYPNTGESRCGVPLTLFPSTITLHVIRNYPVVPIRFLLDRNIGFFAKEIVKYIEKNL